MQNRRNFIRGSGLVLSATALGGLAACSRTSTGGGGTAGGGDGGGDDLLSRLQKAGKITVGFAGEAPYSFEDGGELMGATVAMHREIFGELGIDIGAEAFAKRGGAVERLLVELGLESELVDPRTLGSWGHADGASYPLPKASILGIPADPADEDVRRALGPIGALRSSMERFIPRNRGIEDGVSVAQFVRTRYGARVLERLVAPII